MFGFSRKTKYAKIDNYIDQDLMVQVPSEECARKFYTPDQFTYYQEAIDFIQGHFKMFAIAMLQNKFGEHNVEKMYNHVKSFTVRVVNSDELADDADLRDTFFNIMLLTPSPVSDEEYAKRLHNLKLDSDFKLYCIEVLLHDFENEDDLKNGTDFTISKENRLKIESFLQSNFPDTKIWVSDYVIPFEKIKDAEDDLYSLGMEQLYNGTRIRKGMYEHQDYDDFNMPADVVYIPFILGDFCTQPCKDILPVLREDSDIVYPDLTLFGHVDKVESDIPLKEAKHTFEEADFKKNILDDIFKGVQTELFPLLGEIGSDPLQTQTTSFYWMKSFLASMDAKKNAKSAESEVSVEEEKAS